MKKSLLTMFLPLILLGQNLEELVDLSLENQLIKSFEYNTDSIKDEYKALKSSYLPSLDLNSKYSYTNKETANLAKNALTTSTSINYTLFDGKKKNSYEKYKQRIKGSQESLNSIKNQLSLDISSYYFNYLAILAKKKAKQKEIEQLKAQEKRLTKFLDVGTTTKDEVEKILSRVQSETVNLHSLELDLQTILSNLEYITGKKIDITRGSKISYSKIIKESNRADIKALEYEVNTQLENAKIEKSNYYPTLTIDNSYTKYDYDYDNSSYDFLEDQNILSLNLKWNLYSFGETKNKYEAQYKRYLSLKSKYEYEKNKAQTALELAKKAYKIAILKVKAAKASVRASNSAYEVIKSKYENGLIENVAFLESLSEKYDAIALLQAAIFDLEIKKATIIYQSGENLKDYIK